MKEEKIHDLNLQPRTCSHPINARTLTGVCQAVRIFSSCIFQASISIGTFVSNSLSLSNTDGTKWTSFKSFTYFSDILFKGFRPQGLLVYRLYLHKICTSIIFIYDSTLLSCSSFCVFKISMHHTVLIEAFVLQVDVLHSSTVTLFIALLAYRVCDSVASSCDGILHTKD